MARTRAFDLHAPAYDAWFETHPGAYHAELAALRALLPCVGHGVEIGVGSARFAQPLGVVFGVEPSAPMRVVGHEKGVCVAAGVAEALPIRNTALDYALMVTTICFLDDLEQAFREVYRILKPGGQFIIGFIDRDSNLGRQYQARKATSVFYQEATFYSVDEVVSSLRSLGFVDFSFVQTLFDDANAAGGPVQTGFGKGAFVVVRAGKPT